MTKEQYRWLDLCELLLFEFNIEWDIIAERFPQCAEALDNYLCEVEQQYQQQAHQAQEDEQWHS